MNPPRHRDAMTLASWLNLTITIAIVLPISAIFALVLIALPILAPSLVGTFVTLAVVNTTIVTGGCMTIHLMLRHKMTRALLRLIDLCREYAGGDHTVRAEVLGNDAFALLCASFNSLLDAQGIDSPAQDDDAPLGYRTNSMLALQAQVERLQRLVEQAIQDQEEETFSRGIRMLTETFASMIDTLAGIIGHVQDASLQMMTVIHGIDDEWRTQMDEQSTQITSLIESRDAQGAQVDFLQRSSQHADLTRDTAKTIEQQTMTSKQSIYQSLEALYRVLEQLGRASEHTQPLEQLATEMLPITEELGTLGGHLSLLAQGSAGQLVQAESPHPVVEADLVYLAQMAAMLTPRLSALTERLRSEAQSATEELTSSRDAVTQGITHVSEVGRMLTAMVLDTSRHAQDLSTWSTTIQDEIPQAQAQVQALDLLLGYMRQTQQISHDLHARLLTLVDISEQLRASVAVARAEALPIRPGEHDEVPVTALTQQITG